MRAGRDGVGRDAYNRRGKPTDRRFGMIGTIRHKGLKRLFEQDDPSGVNAEHANKLRDILATLHAASTVAHMALPNYRLHPLKGHMKGFWAVTVQANWLPRQWVPPARLGSCMGPRYQFPRN